MKNRHCRWGEGALTNLRHGTAAPLTICLSGRLRYWLVSRSERGFRVLEEIGPCRYLPSVEVDTSFGPELKHWSSDHPSFLRGDALDGKGGCLYCRVLYAALASLGLEETP